jgi:hypothetical protein
LVTLLCSEFTAAQGTAQDRSWHIGAASAWGAVGEDSALADLCDVVRAYLTARRWIDSFECPKLDAEDANVELRQASGVCVILRRTGRIIGTGIDVKTDDARMLRRAVSAAFNQVLSDPSVRSLAADIQLSTRSEPDAEQRLQTMYQELGRSITLELEVAGKLVPLVGTTLTSMAAKLEPGLDGVAVRRGQSWEFHFPARMRAANTGADPGQLLTNALLQAGIPLKDIQTAVQRQDLSIYRFRTTTLLQSAPNKPPFQTYRGDVVVSANDVNAESIARFADGLAKHILVSLWPEPPQPEQTQPPSGDSLAQVVRQPVGIVGDYSVVADQYRPLIAPPMHQALAAFALNRYATAPNVDAHVATEAQLAATRILVDLSILVDGEADPLKDVGACAAVVYAVCERPEVRKEPGVALLFNGACAVVAAACNSAIADADNDVRASIDGRTQEWTPHEHAMAAGAMSRLWQAADLKERAVETDTVRRLLDRIWQSTPEQNRIALLPWIGWAEIDFARATGQALANQDESRRMIIALDRSRIAADRTGNADWSAEQAQLAGGFALKTQSAAWEGTPRASAQSVRPAAWLASAVADPQLVPVDQQPIALGNHVLTMRFLIQLACREALEPTYRNPKRALGGIREALWDSSQSVPAQALGLIAATDTIRTLNRLNK